MTAYFDQLAEHLRAGGVADNQVTATIDDLSTYAAETGADPEAEFGPVAEFAGELLPAAATAGTEPNASPDPAAPAAAGAPSDDGEPWVWRADAFGELRKLETYGDQGWEVERVDSAGRFVSRRDREHPQRWEYRRELVRPHHSTSALEAELAPDGWEPCGTWVCYAYFKRPRAASIGPEARIDQPRQTPGRTSFYSARFYLLLFGVLALLVAVVAAVALTGGRLVGGNFATGALVGGMIGAAAMVVAGAWLIKRAETRANRE
ncbi:hypothetical protein [Flindersiella endophytica]